MSEIRYQDMDIVWDDEIEVVARAIEKRLLASEGMSVHPLDIATVAIKALRAHDKKARR